MVTHRFEFDDHMGVIKGYAYGFWNGPEAAAYMADLRTHVHEARHRYGKVRVLIDAREASVHSREAVGHLMTYDKIIRGKTDRMAIVVSSSLKKQQVSPTLPPCGKAFLSMNAAQTWLFAYDGDIVERSESVTG